MEKNELQMRQCEKFVYGRQLLKVLDGMKQDPEIMAKIKARVEENRKKAATAPA